MTALSDAAAALDTTLGTLTTEIATFVAAAEAARAADANNLDVTPGKRGPAENLERYRAVLKRAVDTAVERGEGSSKIAVDLSAIYPA